MSGGRREGSNDFARLRSWHAGCSGRSILMARSFLSFFLAASVAMAPLAAHAEDPYDDGGWFDPEAEPAPTPTPDGEDAQKNDAEKPDEKKGDAEKPAVPEKTPAAAKADPAAVAMRPARDPGLPEWYYTGGRTFLVPVEGHDPPPGYFVSKRNRRGVWVGGIVISAVGYGLSALSASLIASNEHDPDIQWKGIMPVAGPFLAATSDMSGESRGLLVGLGFLQAIGFGMVVGGAIVRIPTWKLGAPPKSKQAAQVEVVPGPVGGSMKVTF